MINDQPVALRKPLNEVTERTIRCVCEAASALDINLLLCGATARVLLLEHIYECEPGRQTNDVDFVFAVNDWSQHDALARQLTATGLWESKRGKPLHRLSPTALGRNVYPLDLIPYGAIENEHGDISWPPRQEIAMSMLGFAEADRCAMRVVVAQDLVINVVDIVSIAMLKLIAWHDRKLDPDGQRKHAQDFASILKGYGELPPNRDRVYTKAPDVFERADGDVLLVGAWLLGREVGERAGDLTWHKLQAVFDERDKLMRNMQATVFFTATERSEEFFTYFVDGFQSSLL